MFLTSLFVWLIKNVVHVICHVCKQMCLVFFSGDKPDIISGNEQNFGDLVVCGSVQFPYCVSAYGPIIANYRN